MLIELLSEYFGARLQAIVVFGSRATGSAKPWSDLDVLVVVTELGDWDQRTSDMLVLSRQMEVRPHVDWVLLTPEECRSNFESRHPFYLDIAFDGVVLFDREFVTQIMEEIRAYVARRGIIRKPTGWKFPVEYRKETPLSKATNGDTARAWIETAERDWESAHLEKAGGVYENAVYHCQQAVEKYIKAILICWGEFEKTHYVSETLRQCLSEQELDPTWRQKLEQVAEIGHVIEPEVWKTRYPALFKDGMWIPLEQYDEIKAADALEKAEWVRQTTKEFVEWWFHPEKTGSEGDE